MYRRNNRIVPNILCERVICRVIGYEYGFVLWSELSLAFRASAFASRSPLVRPSVEMYCKTEARTIRDFRLLEYNSATRYLTGNTSNVHIAV